MTGNADVVVIGGGYAGVMAANRLMQRDDVTVTLINPRPTFVERIHLHQLVGGSHDAVVAETVLSRIAGKQPAPINVGFAGQCISLGRRAGIFQFAHRNDTAIRLYIADRPGAKLKEFVCKSTVWQLAYEARKPGSRTWWVKDDKRQQLLQAKRGEAPATAERAA